MIHDILSVCQYMHCLERKLGLISAGLLFYDYQNHAFQFLDVSLDEYICLVDKSMHTQIICNFGYFDPFVIDTIDKSSENKYKKEYIALRPQDEELTDLYIKTDIVLILVLINFLFSTKKISKKREIPLPNSTFEKYLNDLMKDFLSNNHKFPYFLSTSNNYTNQLKMFLEENLSLEYDNVGTVKKLLAKISEMIKRDLESELCINCQDMMLEHEKKEIAEKTKSKKQVGKISNPNLGEGGEAIVTETTEPENSVFVAEYKSLNQLFIKDYLEFYDKKIRLDCYHMVCKFCFFDHNCDKIITSKFAVKDNKEGNKEVKSKTDMISRRLEGMHSLNSVDITDYFHKEIAPVIEGIQDQHVYFQRILCLEEETIESLAEYLEFCLKQQIDSQNELLEKNIVSCKNQINEVLSEIESYKMNNIASNKFQANVYENKSLVVPKERDTSTNSINNNNNVNNKVAGTYSLVNTNTFNLFKKNPKNVFFSNRNINNTSVYKEDDQTKKHNDSLKTKIESLLVDKDICQLFGKKIDVSLNKAQELVNFINKMKGELNNHKEMKLLFQEINRITQDYITDFKDILESDLKECIENVNIFSNYLKEDPMMKYYEKFTLQTNDSNIASYSAFISKYNELVVVLPIGGQSINKFSNYDADRIENKEFHIDIRNFDQFRALVMPINFPRVKKGKGKYSTSEVYNASTPKPSHLKDNKSKPKVEVQFSLLRNTRMVSIKNKVFAVGGLDYIVERDSNYLTTEEGEEEVIIENYVSSKESFCVSFNMDLVSDYIKDYNDLNNDFLNHLQEEIKEGIKWEKLAQMNNKRDHHSLIKLSEYEIAAISGYSTPTCEVYSIKDNSWNEIVPLPLCLYNTSCMIHNGVYVYVFFGLVGAEGEENEKKRISTNKKGFIYSEKIYRYNLYRKFSSKQWEKLSFKYDTSKLYFNFILPGLLPCKDEKSILILGGKHISDDHLKLLNKRKESLDKGKDESKFHTELSNKIYLLNIETNTITTVNWISLKLKSYFPNSLLFKDRFYEKSIRRTVNMEYGNLVDQEEIEKIAYSEKFILVNADFDSVTLKKKDKVQIASDLEDLL
eukprot:CAMPEP_0170539576 /NCGR_PEP_ID=MMETSP0209-20121228/104032_1 /TAXON_ID=665100 ORGANISM="Litonotus pictus, Strain P1" /NCGR_SAMPLE_ID=MMETSP0209 /ASSEMBLY_ACC=CAM_ASM_000301 /LENGTH=1078 /DNA_ID=CAMNT_0010841577 /DNA_START=596 /DNA_END=3832 /DNA_ORIENTATION=-